MHGVIAALAEVPGCAEQALQMFLTGALAASEEARLEIIAYEFVEQARPYGLVSQRRISLKHMTSIFVIVC